MNKSAGARDSLDICIVILKQAVERLEEERADCLWELNLLQASTRDLPRRILAHIFLLASGDCDDYRGQRIPLKFMGVCALWREITLSTPHLWSSLALRISAKVNTSTKQHNIANLLQHYLVNVGTVPFSLDLCFDTPTHCYRPATGSSQLSTGTLDFFSSVLFSDVNARKVHGLKISHAPFEWITSFPKFPNLESLNIYGPTGCLDRILLLPLINSPRLHYLVFDDLRPRGPLPWHRELVPSNVEQTQITRISLTGVPANICVTLLVLCPNVTHFESTNPAYADMEGDELQAYGLIDGPIVLSHLEHFGWTHPSPPGAFIQTYQRLRFPVLRTFRWHANEYSHPDYNALRVLLPNLSSTILRLEVLFADEWPMSLVELMFTYGATARELYLDGCNYTTMSRMIIALGRKGVGRGGEYLPQLEKMSINRLGANFESDDGCRDLTEIPMVGHIVDTFRCRCRPPHTGFVLELSRCHGVWTDEMREAYWLLREEGHAGLKVWAVGEKRYLLGWEILPGVSTISGLNCKEYVLGASAEVDGDRRGMDWCTTAEPISFD